MFLIKDSYYLAFAGSLVLAHSVQFFMLVSSYKACISSRTSPEFSLLLPLSPSRLCLTPTCQPCTHFYFLSNLKAETLAQLGEATYTEHLLQCFRLLLEMQIAYASVGAYVRRNRHHREWLHVDHEAKHMVRTSKTLHSKGSKNKP